MANKAYKFLEQAAYFIAGTASEINYRVNVGFYAKSYLLEILALGYSIIDYRADGSLDANIAIQIAALDGFARIARMGIDIIKSRIKKEPRKLIDIVLDITPGAIGTMREIYRAI